MIPMGADSTALRKCAATRAASSTGSKSDAASVSIKSSFIGAVYFAHKRSTKRKPVNGRFGSIYEKGGRWRQPQSKAALATPGPWRALTLRRGDNYRHVLPRGS